MVSDLQTPCMDDGYDEAAVENYVDEVMKRFAASLEFREGGEGSWRAGVMLQYGLAYLSVGVAEMTRRDLDEILFEIFPRKVSCDASEAPATVRELHAFWRFAKRELGAAGADGCLDVLGRPGVAAELERELADPRNYGPAKSFVMGGRAAGYDMTTDKGMREWQEVYNARMLSAAASRPGGPYEVERVQDWGPRGAGMDEAARRRDAERREKRKRKTQRASRRRNRNH